MSIYYLLYKTPNKHLCLSVVQLGTHHLSFRAPLLVGSDPEELVRLLHVSYGVQFVVYANLFVVVRRCRSRRCHFKALPSSTIEVLEPIPHYIYWDHRGFWKARYNFLALRMAFF